MAERLRVDRRTSSADEASTPDPDEATTAAAVNSGEGVGDDGYEQIGEGARDVSVSDGRQLADAIAEAATRNQDRAGERNLLASGRLPDPREARDP